MRAVKHFIAVDPSRARAIIFIIAKDHMKIRLSIYYYSRMYLYILLVIKFSFPLLQVAYAGRNALCVCVYSRNCV